MPFGKKKQPVVEVMEPSSFPAEWQQAATAVLCVLGIGCVCAAFWPKSKSKAPFWINTLAFTMNVIFVALPGRFDGDEESVATNTFPWPT